MGAVVIQGFSQVKTAVQVAAVLVLGDKQLAAEQETRHQQVPLKALMEEHLLLALQIMGQAAGEVQVAQEQIPPIQLVGMAG